MLEKWTSLVKLSGKEEVIKIFFETVEPFNFVVAGGWSVSLYVNNRLPTVGDIDILLDLSNWEDFRNILENKGFKVGGLGGYGLTTAKVYKDNIFFDILLTDNPWEEEALNYATQINWKGLKIKIIYPEYIIVMKLYAGRDKDLRDIILITQDCKVNIQKLKKIVIQHLGQDFWEDLKQLFLIAKKLSFSDNFQHF